MSEPLVCAICLTRDRPAMLRRAIESFRSQTYDHKRLFVLDNGLTPTYPASLRSNEVALHWQPSFGKSVGTLRNMANDLVATGLGQPAMNDDSPKILVHWDSDDWSHPNRIAEQVSLLQASEAECVGYHSMYFFRAAGIGRDPQGTSRSCPLCATIPCSCDDQVYLYDGSDQPGYALGTSLCYWRKTWEQRPFLDVPWGEDSKFVDGTGVSGERIHEPLRVASLSANEPYFRVPRITEYPDASAFPTGSDPVPFNLDTAPRLIASIHPDSISYKAGYRRRLNDEPWSRVTDAAVIEQVRKVMVP